MWSDSNRTKENSFKLNKGTFRLDGGKKKLFPWRVVRNRLPREAVDTPFLEVDEARMYEALGSLIWCSTTLPMAGGWN